MYIKKQCNATYLSLREQHTLQIKCDALRRHLYCGETNTQLAKCFNVSTSTVATWKKNASKILDSVGKPSYNQVCLQESKYQDVELALLCWLKDMRSKDVPPPITLTLLRGKAEKYDIFLISLDEYIKLTFGRILSQLTLYLITFSHLLFFYLRVLHRTWSW